MSPATRRLACALLLVAGCELTAGPREPAPRRELRVLQLNLCHSGHVACYRGEAALSRATALIDAARPDLVALNEVCRADVARLAGAGGYRGAFVAARLPEGAPVTCTNGDDYGSGLLHRAATAGSASGTFAAQDGGLERRVWLCATLADGTAACATHLSTVGPVAMAQCRELLGAPLGSGPRIVAGDLNLRAAAGPLDVRGCVPRGYSRADDRSVQHVLASADFDVVGSEVIDMQGTTDHPALLVRLSN